MKWHIQMWLKELVVQWPIPYPSRSSATVSFAVLANTFTKQYEGCG